nr:hypothetical protein [Tanacetum cinerariifolium]
MPRVLKRVFSNRRNKRLSLGSKSVVIQDTSSTPKSKPATSKTKLKGDPSLTPQEQEATDIMQALKESKKTSGRQPCTGGLNEGIGSKPGVPDEDKDITEEKVILKWGDEKDSEFFDDDNDDVEKDDKDGDVDDEGDDYISDTQEADDEDVKTESDEDNIYKYKIRFTIKSIDKAALEEYDMKSALYQSMHTNKSFNRNSANHRLYHALMEALIEDENAMDKGVSDTVKDHKRKHDDDEEDDDEDPPARPNHGKKTKRRRTKESESTKKPSSTKENPKGKTPTKGFKTGHRIVAADYFFNNYLEYLRTFDPDVTYTTFITKAKDARYEIKVIEDMVPTLWSTIKHAYDKDASIGIKHQGERRKLWYRSQKRLVKRSNQQLYKFKEGDFFELHLNDIEDMLLLAIQHKLFHLDGSDIIDFIVALRIFTRSLILKRRIKDLQLGVESYQKNINITKPHKTFPEIEFKEPYTPSYDPPGIVFEELDKPKRVLQADELYKFSDGTLKSVCDKIQYRVLEFRLDYNPKMPKRK